MKPPHCTRKLIPPCAFIIEVRRQEWKSHSSSRTTSLSIYSILLQHQYNLVIMHIDYEPRNYHQNYCNGHSATQQQGSFGKSPPNRGLSSCQERIRLNSWGGQRSHCLKYVAVLDRKASWIAKRYFDYFWVYKETGAIAEGGKSQSVQAIDRSQPVQGCPPRLHTFTSPFMDFSLGLLDRLDARATEHRTLTF